jgi:hypothetical protein
MPHPGVILGGVFAILVSMGAVILVKEWAKGQQRDQLVKQFVRAAPMANAGGRADADGWVNLATLHAVPFDDGSGLRFRPRIKKERRTMPDGTVEEVQVVGWSHYSESLRRLDSDPAAVGGSIPESFEFRLVTPAALEILEEIHRLGPIDELLIEAHSPRVFELPTIQRDLELLEAALPEAEILLNHPKSSEE